MPLRTSKAVLRYYLMNEFFLIFEIRGPIITPYLQTPVI